MITEQEGGPEWQIDLAFKTIYVNVSKEKPENY